MMLPEPIQIMDYLGVIELPVISIRFKSGTDAEKLLRRDPSHHSSAFPQPEDANRCVAQDINEAGLVHRASNGLRTVCCEKLIQTRIGSS